MLRSKDVTEVEYNESTRNAVGLQNTLSASKV